MSNLDPATHLPQKPESDEERRQRLISGLSQHAQRRSRVPVQGQDVFGTFGKYSPEINITGDSNFNERRAQDQSYLSLVGKSTAQSLGAIVGGGVVSGIGFLADLPEYLGRGIYNIGNWGANQFRDEEEKKPGIGYSFERNALSQFGDHMHHFFMDNFEIYQTERAQSGTWRRFLDPTHRTSLMPSILSTLSLMIPTGMAAGVIRGLGRMGQLGQKANRISTTIGAGIVSRHNYNMMEGFDVMDRTFEHLLAQGKDYNEAKALASQTASNYYNVGYVNIWKDMAQWGFLLRGMNFANRSTKATLASMTKDSKVPALQKIRQVLIDRPSATVKEAVERAGYTWKDWLLQAGLEGVEEFNIQFQKNLMMRNTDILLGLQDGEAKGFWASYFSKDLIEEMKNPETQDAALMGFLGGALFQGVGQLYQRRDARKHGEMVANQHKQFEAQLEYLQEQFKMVERLAEQGNTEMVGQIKENIVLTLGLSGVQQAGGGFAPSFLQGNVANTLEWFEAIQHLSDSEIVELGLAENVENATEVRENAQWVLQEMGELNQIYDKYADQNYGTEISDIVNIFLTEQEYLNKKAQERTGRLQSEVANILKAEDIQADLKNFTGQERSVFDARTKLYALRRLLKNKEAMVEDVSGLNMFRYNLNQEVNNISQVKIKEEIEALEQQLKEAPAEAKTKPNEVINKHIKPHKRFNDALTEQLFNEYLVSEGEILLSKYKDPATHDEFARVYRSSSEAVMQDIFEFQVKTSIPDGHFLRATLTQAEGEQTYIVNHNEDGSITVEKYDAETQELSGEPFQLKREHLFEVTEGVEGELKQFTTMRPEDVVTPERKKETMQNIKDSLEKHDFENAFSDMRRLFTTGFAADARRGTELIEQAAKDYVEGVRSIEELMRRKDHLSSLLQSSSLKNRIVEMISAKISEITEQLQREQQRLGELVEKNHKSIEALDKQLQNIDSELASFESKEQAIYQEEIGGWYTRILREYREAENKVEAKEEFDKKLASLINKNLKRKTAVQTRIEALQNAVSERRSALVKERTQAQQQMKFLLAQKKRLDNILEPLEIASEKGETILPDVIIKSQLKEAVNELDSIALEIISDTYYNLDKVRDYYNITDVKAEIVIHALGSYAQLLSKMSDGNTVVWKARNNAMHKILTEGFQEFADLLEYTNVNEEAVLINKVLEKYRNYVSQEITNQMASMAESRKTPKLIKAVNKTRQFINTGPLEAIYMLGDMTNESFQEIKTEHPDAVELSQKFNELIEARDNVRGYTYIIRQMRAVVAEAINNIKEGKKRTPKSSDVAKRRPENMFNRATGKTHFQVEDGSWIAVDSEQQLRYGATVNSLNPYTQELSFEVVKPEDVGINIPKQVREEYGDSPILYGIVTDKNGKYLTSKKGEVTDTFDPNVNVYTSLPSINQTTKHSLQYVDDIGYIQKLFPKIKGKEALTQALQELVAKRLEEHGKLVEKALSEIEKGNKFYLEIVGKNLGTPIRSADTNYDTADPNPVSRIAQGPVQFHIFNSPTESVGDIGQVTRKKGDVVAYETETGNIIDVVGRRLSTDEQFTAKAVLVKFLNTLSVNSKGRVEVEGRKAYQDIRVEGIDIHPIEYLRLTFNKNISTQIFPKDKGVNPDPHIKIGDKVIPIFQKDNEGKLINKKIPELQRILEDNLRTWIYNINNKVQSSDPFFYYRYDKKADTFTSERFENYSQFIYKNNVASTWQRDPGDMFLTKDGVETKVQEPRFMNQNFEYHNEFTTSIAEEGGESTGKGKVEDSVAYNLSKVYTGPMSSERDAVRKSVKEKLTNLVKQQPAKFEDTFPIYREIAAIEKKENKLTDFKDLFTDNETATKVAETIGKDNDKFVKTLTFLLLWNQAHDQWVKNEIAESQEQGFAEPDVTVTRDDVDTTTKEDKKEDTDEFSDDSDLGAGDMQLRSMSEVISEVEARRIAKDLLNRTGVPTNFMTPEQALHFLNFIYGENFTAETLPAGMNRKGVAYVFGNPRLDTPFHEVTHSIVDQILQDNPALFESLKQEVINNAPHLIERIKKFQRQYKDANYISESGEFTTSGWAEAVTTAIGEDAAGKYDVRKNKGLIGKLQEVWESILQWIREKLNIGHINLEGLSRDTTIGELGTLLGLTKRKIIVTPSTVERQYQRSDAPKAHRVTKIISGAQTGADMAGLDAAVDVGIQTGGTAAAYFTQDVKGKKVKNPELAKKYGLKEGKAERKTGKYGPYQDVYHQRTIANAQEADATIWFGDTKSAGGKLTLGNVAQKGKPKPLVNPKSSKEILDWLNKNNIRVLNVAGNREAKTPGIYASSKKMLAEALNTVKETTVDTESIADFVMGDTYGEPVSSIESPNVIKGTDTKFTQEAMETMNQLFFALLFNKYSDKIYTLFSSEGGRNMSLYSDIIQDVHKSLFGQDRDSQGKPIRTLRNMHTVALANAKTSEEIATISQQQENLSLLEANFEQAIELHKRHLARYNVEAITEEVIKSDTEKNSNELWVTESLKYSSKQTSSSNIKMLVASLNNVVLRNGKKVPSRGEYFGNIELVDFGSVFNMLANRLANLDTISDMKDMLIALQDQPGISQLAERVFKENPTKAEILQILQFAQTFAKHRNNYNFSFIGEGGVFNTADAVVNTMQRRKMGEWSSNLNRLRHNKNLFTQREGMVVYNQEWFKRHFQEGVLAAMGRIDEKSSYTKASALPKEVYFTTQQKDFIKRQKRESEKKLLRTYYRAINPLKLLGIEIDVLTLPKSETPQQRGKGLNEFIKSIDGIFKSIANESDMDVLGPYSNVKEYIQPILNHVMANSNDFVENQFYNFNNETQYLVNLNNYLTQVEDVLNTVEHTDELGDVLPHLTDVYNSDSLILNRQGLKNTPNVTSESFFLSTGERNNSLGNELNMTILEGIKNETTGDGIQFNQMEYVDKLWFNVNGSTHNVLSMHTPGDNSLKRVYRLPQLVHNLAGFQNQMGKYLNTEINYFADILDKGLNEGMSTNLLYPTDNQIINKHKLTGEQNNPENINRLRANEMYEKSMFKDILDKVGLKKQYVDAVLTREFSDTALSKFKVGVQGALSGEINNLFDHALRYRLIIPDGGQYRNIGLSTKTDVNKPTPVLNRKQIEDILQQSIINKSIWNIEQTKLFTGHPALYKDADNFYKRMSALVGTKKRLLADEMSITSIESHFPRIKSKRLFIKDGNVSDQYTSGAQMVTRTAVFNDIKVVSSVIDSIKEYTDPYAYENINEPDAIALINLDGYRDFKLLAGIWSKDQERLYQWLNRKEGATHIDFEFEGVSETVTVNDLKNVDGTRTVFNMLKPQYFGPLAQDGFTPAMYKLGVIPVLPNLGKEHTNSHALIDFMNRTNTDLVTFESANKIGTQQNSSTGIQNLYDNEGNFSVADKNNDNKTIYQDTYTKYWGIQLETGDNMKREVSKGSQFMKIIFSNVFDKYSPNQALESKAREILDIHNKLVEHGVNELKEQFGLKDTGEGRYSPESVKNLLSYIRKQSLQRNANNNVLDSLEMIESKFNKFGLDIISNRDKIENILASLASDRIFSQKIHGGGFIQASSTTFETMTYLNEKGQREYADKGTRMKSNFLRFIPETGTMQVMLPHRFKEALGEVSLDNVDPKLLNMVGFRIPTSGLNSIERIQVVKFLPQEYGDTVILPSEIVAKAGSDFDIDKLNIFVPNYKVNKKTGKFEYVEYDPDNITREGLENKLIELSRDMIASKPNKSQHLESIGVTLFEKAEDNILKLQNRKKERGTFTQSMLDVVYQSNVEERNLSSKILTGRTALHNTDHIIAQMHGYAMKEGHTLNFVDGYNKTPEGKVFLGAVKDTEGNYITTTLNQTVNAAVDGAKNPLFYNLNINTHTANTMIYLIRAGIPLEKVMVFLNQPIIRRYIELTSIMKSEMSGGLESVQDVMDIIDTEFGKQEASGNIGWGQMEMQLNPRRTNNATQKKLLKDYLQYQSSAEELNMYIQATRVDTQGIGKNTSELDLRLLGADRVANGETAIENAELSLTSEEGFYTSYYEAMKSIKDLYSDLFIHSKKINGETTEYNNYYNFWVERMFDSYIPFDKKIRVLDQFKSDYISSVVLTSDIRMGGEPYGNISEMATQLLSGEESIAKLLDLEQQQGNQNILIRSLQPIIGRETQKIGDKDVVIDTIKLFDQRLDLIESNTLIEAWGELYAEKPELAKGLAAVTLLQSGLQVSPITYTKYIPAQLYIEIMESAFDNKMNVGEAVNFAEFQAQFVVSNYNNNDIVPTKRRLDKNLLIYKMFEYLPEYNKLLKEMSTARRVGNQARMAEAQTAISEWQRFRKPTRKSKPRIFVNKKQDNLDFEVFSNIPKDGRTDTYELEYTGIKDFVSNQSMLSYGHPIYAAPVTVEGIESNSSTREESTKLKKFCITR